MKQTKRERFFQELLEHIEDGQDPKSIGDEKVLLEAFEIYHNSKNAKNLFIIPLVGIIVISAFPTLIIITQNVEFFITDPYANHYAQDLISITINTLLIPWYILLAPAYVIFHDTGITSFITGGDYSRVLYFEQYFLPPLTAILWMTITALILFRTKVRSTIKNHVYAILKRNLKGSN